MAKNTYSSNKRQREAEKAKKKREKAERKKSRGSGGRGIPIASAEEVQAAVMRGPAQPASDGPRRSSGPGCRLFVGSLSWDTTTQDLRDLFSKCGEVVDAAVINDRDTGRSRGFGFVTMADRKAGAKAVETLDGHELDGRNIKVNVATENRR